MIDHSLLSYALHLSRSVRVEVWPEPPIERCWQALEVIGAQYRKGTPTEAVLKADWYAVDATKAASSRPFKTFLRGYFDRMETAVVARVQDLTAGMLSKAEEDDAPLTAEMLLDIDLWVEELRAGMGPIFSSVAEDGFRSGLARAGVGGIDITSDHPVVLASIQGSLDQSKTVPATQADILARRLNAVLSAGGTQADLSREVASVIGEAKGYRTNMIARTATAAGFESGQIAAYDRSGVEQKAWLTERDANVREGTVYNHVIMDGVTVPVLEAFVMLTSGGLLMHPGDPSGDAGDIINCRCTTRPVI